MSYRPICILDNSFEADLICKALKEESIPYSLHENLDTALGSIYSLQNAWGILLVPDEKFDFATIIIKDVMSAKPIDDAPLHKVNKNKIDY